MLLSRSYLPDHAPFPKVFLEQDSGAVSNVHEMMSHPTISYHNPYHLDFLILQ